MDGGRSMREVGRAGVSLTQAVVDRSARRTPGLFDCSPVDYNNAS